MLRAAAGIGLAAAFAALGLALSREVARRLRLLGAMSASLELLRGEITARLTPLPDCAELLAKRGPAEARQFYVNLCAALPALGEREFAELWAAALETQPLSAEARGALEDLGRSLGRYDAASQGAAIDRCRAALESEYARLRGSAADEARLRVGLALSAGLALAVILY